MTDEAIGSRQWSLGVGSHVERGSAVSGGSGARRGYGADEQFAGGG